MSGDLDRLLDDVRSDRDHGSRELLGHLLDELSPHLPGSDDPGGLRRLCRRIAALRPGMEAFTNLAALLHERCLDPANQRGDSPPSSHDVLGDLRAEHRGSLNRLVEHYREASYPDSSVMVFSRSGSVAEILRTARFDRVYVLESHPGGEGVSLANDLSGTAPVRFLYDLETTAHLPDVDALYLGCDRFEKNGTVTNKTGSHLLARAAGSVPVRVLAETWKYSPEPGGHPGPSRDSPPSLNPSLRREHPLLERVPARLVTDFVTDRGCWTPGEEPPPLPDELVRARRHFPGPL